MLILFMATVLALVKVSRFAPGIDKMLAFCDRVRTDWRKLVNLGRSNSQRKSFS